MIPSPKQTGLIVLLLFSFVSQELGAVVEITDTIKLYPLKSDPECVMMKCPKPGSEQWRALNERCCTEGRYHCQENDVGGMIVYGAHFTCMKPVRCAAGTFFDLRNVILNIKALHTVCRICPPGEFQPKATLSHHLTRSGCKIRTGCSTLNAIFVKTGTSTTDDVCQCNYLKGYRPVSLADNKCLTFESLSGCRCTHEPCPEGKFMSPKDYRCLDPTEFTVISVLVDPSTCKHSFQILHFIQDLLSPESIKKQLTANGTRQDQAVEVTVSYPKCTQDTYFQSLSRLYIILACDYDQANSTVTPSNLVTGNSFTESSLRLKATFLAV